MAEFSNPNLVMLDLALERLGDIADVLVFVGGMATGLLITDRAAPPIRMTQDVDAVVEVAGIGEYHRLAERLRWAGFREDIRPGAPVCRWMLEGVTLDVMPTDPAVLGFGNPWYSLVARTARPTRLASGRSLRLITAPCFLATKLDAFEGRGGGDFVLSHDMEDLIAVLDGRPGIVDEVREAPAELKEFLADRFSRLLADEDFQGALSGHLPPDVLSQQRLPALVRRIQVLTEMI